MADKCEESNSEEMLKVSDVKGDSGLDDSTITKHMTDEELKDTSEIHIEPTTNTNKLDDETDNKSEINLEEQRICADNKNNEGKDSDLVKDNLDNNDCRPKSPKSVVDNNEHQLTTTLNDNSVNSTDITPQTSTNSDVNDKNIEIDIVKTIIKQESLENGDSLIADLNNPTHKTESLVLNSHILVTDHNSESKLVSKDEDLVEICSKTNKSSSEPLLDSGTKKVNSMDINEQSETKDGNVDESENVDTIQPVILEVKSITTDIQTQNTDDLIDVKEQDEEGTSKLIQSVSSDVKVETTDTKSETCEQLKKKGRFEEDNKDKINTGTIEFEVFADKENANIPIQSVSDDKVETTDTKSETFEQLKKKGRFEEDKINTGTIEFETFVDKENTNKPIQSVSDDKVETLDTKSETCEQPKKTERFEEDNKDEINTGTIEFENFPIKLEIIEEEENITDVADENEIAVKMEVDENIDEGVGTSSEYYDEIRESDSYLSKIKPPKNEIKENIEDGIFIEGCKPGVNKNSDKSFIKEGSAEILLSSPKNVFYNPVQEFNRDMSIAALMVFAEDHQTDPRYKNRGVKRKNNYETESPYENKDNSTSVTCTAGIKSENGITILEALSATGLRSIRYAKEVSGIKQIIANDISEIAVENIRKNAEHNGVGDIIVTTKSDASLLMYQHLADDEWYDAIDLDPYGCPSRFLDAAVQAVRDGGILLVTCTDMAVLAGNSPETCHAKYGAVSLRNHACHEMALRITLQCIESHANRYGRYIVPLLSFSADFYIRVIVQVYTSPVTCKKTTSKLSMVYQCVGCQAMTLSPLGLATQVGSNNQMKFSLPHSPPVNMCCSHCFYQHIVGGPIWSAPIHKASFVERMLKVAETQLFATSKRMEGMLEVIKEELPDVPLYYTISGLCSKIHCTAIPLIDFRSALLNAGYRVSLSHASPNSVKTNAPVKTLWDIIRCWVQLNPISQRRLAEGSVSAAILFQEPTISANFERHPKARPNSRVRGLLRFQQNPQKNWGPGTRSRANVGNNLDDRRIAKQNKKSKKTNIEIIEVITISNDEDDVLNS